ncbi:hypothetical protein BC826DRAFT_1043145 [Russula brevipes]|nr:hypothetical protein BC826DRAFT_1043145 [Russula brevipes]
MKLRGLFPMIRHTHMKLRGLFPMLISSLGESARTWSEGGEGEFGHTHMKLRGLFAMVFPILMAPQLISSFGVKRASSSARACSWGTDRTGVAVQAARARMARACLECIFENIGRYRNHAVAFTVSSLPDITSMINNLFYSLPSRVQLGFGDLGDEHC